MTKSTIPKSIVEVSNQNPESSQNLEKKINIHIDSLMIKRYDIKDNNVQTINNNDGTVTQSNSKVTCSCSNTIKQLNKEIQYLKTIIKDKERIIALLEKEKNKRSEF